MTKEELEKLFGLLVGHNPQEVEYRLYYGDGGVVVTYTTEKIPGNYIKITREQFAEARHDVLVVDSKIVYTHKTTHVFKLVKNMQEGVKTSKYDINILCDVDCVYWRGEVIEIY